MFRAGSFVAFLVLFTLASVSSVTAQGSGVSINALYLDGNQAHVLLPPGLTRGMMDATVEVWVRWDTFANYANVFDFGRKGNAALIQGEGTTPTLNYKLYLQNGKKNTIQVKDAVSRGAWVHLAAVCGQGGMKFYINGNLVGENTYTGSLSEVSEGNNFIGKSNWPADALFQGFMTEFRIWDVSRTQTDIARTMYTRLSGAEEHLLGYWRFDQEAAGSARDLTRFGRNASLMGGATISPVSGPSLTSEGAPQPASPPPAPQTPVFSPVPAVPSAPAAAAPVFAPASAPQAEARKRIAIMPLTGMRNDYEARTIIENGLTDIFVQMKRFDVVERSQIQTILQEKQFSQSGIVDETNAASAGQVLGVDYLILGALTEITTVKAGTDKYRAKVSAILKVVSTSNAAVIATVSGTEYSHGSFGGEANLDLSIYVPRAAKKLVGLEFKNKLWTLFPLEGYIISLSGSEEGMIDLGQDQGITKGDRFAIIRQGASIRHPVTGAMLPGSIVELGVGEVSDVDQATSRVKLKLKQGIQVGDRIRMREREKSFWDKVKD